MKIRPLSTALAGVLAATLVSLSFVAPAQAAPAAPAATAAGTVTSTVTGTFTDGTGGAGTFTGTFTPSRFSGDGDQVLSAGTLAGELVDSQGTSLGTVSQEITTPVTAMIARECEILDLDLAPLDLDLLGLQVHLDRVHLVITAVAGPGNLLGNLLCAVVGLFDGAGPLTQVVVLLNLILALLGL